MNKFQQVFTIHPVGQGFFYSGVVDAEIKTDNKKSYKLIFDCGSMNGKNCLDEIETYQRMHLPENDRLDLLIISHFDQDHVNHIHKLLDKRKVHKVIAPFINFDERIFLALRIVQQGNIQGIAADDNFVISLIIDPVGTLGPYLDNDEGGIIFIIPDPEIPTFPLENPNQDIRYEIGNTSSFRLDLVNKDRKLSTGEAKELNTKGARVNILPDSARPKIVLGNIPILDLLFYNKPIGPGEGDFYKVVFELFIEKFKNQVKDTANPTTAEVINIIKGIRSATVIRKIFSEARGKVKSLSVSDSDIQNLNTTALCLLHRNFYHIEKFLRRVDKGDISSEIIIEKIQKFEGLHKNVVVFSSLISEEDLYFRRFRDLNHYIGNIFPNVMLTSDCFLLEPADVDRFYTRYKNYWKDYWLMQVPHHGSANNSNYILLSRISKLTRLFINYGVVKEWNGKWRHPSQQLIIDIVATGNSMKLFAINEFLGLRFQFILV